MSSPTSGPAVELRPATLDDIDTLRVFEQGMLSAERPIAIDLTDQPVTYYDLVAMIEAEDTELLVAQSGSEVIGSGYGRIEESGPKHRSEKHCYVGFMYVVPARRGQGVSSIVLDAVITWGESQGVDVFKLGVYSRNSIAIASYEKFGFAANRLEMVLDRSARENTTR